MMLFYQGLQRLTALVGRITDAVVLFLVVVITVVNVAQILGRFIFFYSLPWSEELSVYIFFWLVMLGGAYCIRDNSELRIDIVNPKKPATARRLRMLQDFLSLIVIVVFFCASWMHMGAAIRHPQVSSSLQISMAYVYCIIPVGFLLMFIEKLLNLVRNAAAPWIKAQ